MNEKAGGFIFLKKNYVTTMKAVKNRRTERDRRQWSKQRKQYVILHAADSISTVHRYLCNAIEY